jgi:hypothetical protein
MPQRMRYNWLVDRPRNVPRRDYERYQLMTFGAVGLGFLSIALLVGSISGLTLWTSRELADLDGMTVEEALAYDGDSQDLVKIEGFLLADDPVTMPDDDGQQVVRGQVEVIAKQPGRSDDEADESSDAETADQTATNPDTSDSAAVPRQVTLLEWEDTAESVFLSDGDRQIPLAFDLTTLPLAEDAGDVEPEYVREGRLQPAPAAPVAVRYGKELLPLPQAYIDQGADRDCGCGAGGAAPRAECGCGRWSRGHPGRQSVD